MWDVETFGIATFFPIALAEIKSEEFILAFGNFLAEEDREDFVGRVQDKMLLDRDEFFYLPGKVLHFDGDKDYLNRCLEFYKKNRRIRNRQKYKRIGIT